MKKYILLIITLLSSVLLPAQTLYSSRHDSIPATGEFFTLEATPYRGNIQWQSSTDGKTWNDLTGQSNSQVNILTSTEAFYRAKITDGNCFVTYSDSAVVLLPRTQNVTVDPKTLTGTALLKSDSVSYSYISTGSTTVKPGTILLNTDSVSGIHIVSGTVQKGDTIIVQTTKGTMADLFVNQSFKLSTAASSNAQSIKGLAGAQLSRALTDANGFIHPAAVVDNNISAAKVVSTTTQANNIPLVSFEKDFSGEKIYEDDNLLLQFTEGYYKFNSELKCEFDFDQFKFDLARLKISGGKLKRFSFYTDPDITGIDTNLILLARARGKISVEKEKLWKPKVYNKSFKFLVGEIPVWMDVTIDLMWKISGEISSELSVSGGATAAIHAKLGATYQNQSWTSINEPTTMLTLQGPEVTGKANEELKVEVYPHITVKLYKIAGPNLDIAPYLRQEMSFSTSGNYNFDVYAGAAARIGAEMEVFGDTILDYKSPDIKLIEKELYKTPKKLKLISGDKQEGTAGVALTNPIVLRALDSKDNPISNYPVNIKSLTGSAGSKVLNTDANGEIQVKWTLDNIEGDQKLEAYLLDGKDMKITTADTIILAKTYITIPTVNTSSVSNITETTATCGGTITKNGGAAVTARGVCWNTTGNPTIINSKTTDGTGDGRYTSTLTGLKKGDFYYARAYATNSKGTSYGEELIFFFCAECPNPTIILNSNTTFTLKDKITGLPDIIDISGNYNATDLNFLIFSSNYFVGLSFVPPNKIKWENVGTRLTARTIIGYIVAKSTTNECRGDAVFAEPEEIQYGSKTFRLGK